MSIQIGRVGYVPLGWQAVRCDRNVGSPFQNPFKDGTRDEKCDKFHTYFHEQRKILGSPLSVAYARLCRKHNLGVNIYLQCHCTGVGRCHTETIKDQLERDSK